MPTNSGYIEDAHIKQGSKNNFVNLKIDGYTYKLFEDKLNEDDTLYNYEPGQYVKVKWWESKYTYQGEERTSRVVNEIETMQPDDNALNSQTKTSGYPENLQNSTDLQDIQYKLQSIENLAAKDYDENTQTLQHLVEALSVLNNKIDKIAESLGIDKSQFEQANLFKRESNAN